MNARIPQKGIASADIAAAMRFFRAMEVDQLVPYEKLSEALSFNVLKNRSRIDRAVRKLWDEGCFIVCERTVGYRRVNHGKMPEQQAGRVLRIRRTAKVISRIGRALDPEKMTKQEWQEAGAHSALAGVISIVTSKPTLKKLATVEHKSDPNEHTRLLLAQIEGRKS